MPEYEFITVDVFTDQKFGGNQLAVFPDARGLSDKAMQQITREFNFAESSFVLPPADPANHAQVRIFTPAQEIPFAGHPNVGTGYVLAQRAEIFGRQPDDVLLFEEGAGLVRVTISREGKAINAVAVQAAVPFERRQAMEPALIAPCLGLAPAQITTRSHPPVIATVGLAFCIVELVDAEALKAASPVLAAFQRAAAEADHLTDDRLSIYAYVKSGDQTARARMFAPLGGTWEDAATGSAAGALGALRAWVAGTDGTHHLAISQGVEMGRPSTIEVTVERIAGRVDQVVIGGKSVSVTRGTLSL